ncbi:unnamed protein product [Lepidochelys kempii]
MLPVRGAPARPPSAPLGYFRLFVLNSGRNFFLLLGGESEGVEPPPRADTAPRPPRRQSSVSFAILVSTSTTDETEVQQTTACFPTQH